MIVSVKVFPKSKKDKIREENGILKIYTKEPAERGKANNAVIELLSDYFNVKKANIRIVKGMKQRNKTVELIR